MKSFLWIGITFATFSFSGNIPIANDALKMIERYLDISSVSSHRILVGILLVLPIFLGLKFEIISIISSFVQGEMKSETRLDGRKYCNCSRSVKVWSSRLIIFGESFVVFWREIMDLIPFQVFFMLLILSSKYLS